MWTKPVNGSFAPHLYHFPPPSLYNICHFSILLFLCRKFSQEVKFRVSGFCLLLPPSPRPPHLPHNVSLSKRTASTILLPNSIFSLPTTGESNADAKENWWVLNWTTFVGSWRVCIAVVEKTNHFASRFSSQTVCTSFLAFAYEKVFSSINLILKYIIDQHWYSICVSFAIWRRIFFSLAATLGVEDWKPNFEETAQAERSTAHPYPSPEPSGIIKLSILKDGRIERFDFIPPDMEMHEKIDTASNVSLLST